MENSIKTILVMPSTIHSFSYYINGGERHICSEKKLNKILSNISFSLHRNASYFIIRKLSFIINVENQEVIEITIPDNAIMNDFVRKFSNNYNKNTNESIKYQQKRNSFVNKFWRK